MRLLVLGIALAVSAPAVASNDEAPKPAAAETKVAKQKKVCRVEDGSSTSRMRKRSCRTVTEWEDAKAGKADASDLQRHSAN